MSYQVKISALYIGQGLANTIEVINTAAAANADCEYLAIYDCGSAAGYAHNAFNANDTIERVNNCMLRRYNHIPVAHQPAAPYDRYVDDLFISHLDADHYNFLNQIRSSTINRIMIGGADHNTINGLRFILRIPLVPPAPVIAPYPLPAPYHNILNPAFVPLPTYRRGPVLGLYNPYPLIPGQGIQYDFGGNSIVLSPICYQLQGLHGGFEINRASMILLVSVIQNQPPPNPPIVLFSALFTGDATTDTAVNFVGVPATRFNFGNEYKFITMPHHGSATTMTIAAVNDLLANYCPHTAIASAAQMYHHPSIAIFDRFDWHIDNAPASAIVPNAAVAHDVNLYDQNAGPADYYIFHYNSHTYTTYINPVANPGLKRNLIATLNIPGGGAANTIQIDNNEYN